MFNVSGVSFGAIQSQNYGETNWHVIHTSQLPMDLNAWPSVYSRSCNLEDPVSCFRFALQISRPRTKRKDRFPKLTRKLPPLGAFHGYHDGLIPWADPRSYPTCWSILSRLNLCMPLNGEWVLPWLGRRLSQLLGTSAQSHPRSHQKVEMRIKLCNQLPTKKRTKKCWNTTGRTRTQNGIRERVTRTHS